MFWVMHQQLTVCSLSVHYRLHLQQCEQLSFLLQHFCFQSIIKLCRTRCSSVSIVSKLRNGQERNRDSISSRNEASRLNYSLCFADRASQYISIMELTWCTFHSVYWEPKAYDKTTSVPRPTDIIRTKYTKCCLCSDSWGWASNARIM
jgi:hypothetical protein